MEYYIRLYQIIPQCIGLYWIRQLLLKYTELYYILQDFTTLYRIITYYARLYGNTKYYTGLNHIIPDDFTELCYIIQANYTGLYNIIEDYTHKASIPTGINIQSSTNRKVACSIPDGVIGNFH